MKAVERVEAIIASAVDALGYEIVRVQLSNAPRPVLQIMVDRKDGVDVTLDDCETVSRTVSALLDVEDPLAGAFVLEVSSPGIDRPLTRPKDFERFAGFEARIELASLHDGRKRFRGRLLGLAGDQVRLALSEGEPPGEVTVPLALIDKAKLVLTDELIAAHTRH